MIISAIKYGIDMGASDVHITENKVPFIRKTGELIPCNKMSVIVRDEIIKFIERAVPHMAKKFFSYDNIDSLDFAHTVEEAKNTRIRCQIFRSKNGFAIAIRILSNEIPQFETLQLPDSLKKFTQMNEGLIVFTGVTGSGKSTSMASLIQKINETRKTHIITIEDPIEYIYKEKLAKIEQREIGNHVTSFSEATRDALRQDPDILLVGEMRDLETIQNALQIAETGHLVFGTLHANSTFDTMDRIVNMFPSDSQNSIRNSLANSLKAVVNQKLIKSLKGDRVPLCEVLIIDDTIENLIKKQKDRNNFKDHMRPKSDDGNVHIIDNVLWHINKGNITLDMLKNIIDDNDYKTLETIVGRKWGM